MSAERLRRKAAPLLAHAAPPTQFDREVATLCEMCVWRCGVRAKVKDERIYKLEGNPFHPHSRGMLCPRGQAGIATAYDPDRLKYPLIRSGPRGSGKWRRLSWDEALDYVAAQMLAIKNQYGPEAMIFSTTHNLVQTQFENLLKAYGTPNYGTQRSLCYNAMITANLLTFGLEEPGRDYSQTQYIIYTGRNMLDCHLQLRVAGRRVGDRRAGPRSSSWNRASRRPRPRRPSGCPIRPGTDLAFHLALIQVIIEQGLYDADFVKQVHRRLRGAEGKPRGATRPNGRPASARSRPRRSGASPSSSPRRRPRPLPIRTGAPATS